MKQLSTPTIAWTLTAATLAQGVAVTLVGRLDLRLGIEVMVVTAALAGLVHQAWTHRLQLNHRLDMFLVMGVFGGLGMIAGWWVDLGFEAPPRDASFHEAMGHGCGGHGSPNGHAAMSGEQHHATPAAAQPEGDSCCTSGSEQGAHADPEDSSTMTTTSDSMHAGGTFWPMVFSWMTGLMLVGAIPPGILLTRCAQLARESRRRWISTHVIGNALMVAAMIWIGHWIGPTLAKMTGSAVLGGHLGMLAGMLLGMEVGMFAGEALLGLEPWKELTWRADPAKTDVQSP